MRTGDPNVTALFEALLTSASTWYTLPRIRTHGDGLDSPITGAFSLTDVEVHDLLSYGDSHQANLMLGTMTIRIPIAMAPQVDNSRYRLL